MSTWKVLKEMDSQKEKWEDLKDLPLQEKETK